MRKIAMLILTIVVFALIGGQTMYAQLFNPLEESANENLFKNSGWQDGINGWDITSGTLNTNNKFDGCNSISSANNLINISYSQLFNFTNKGHANISFYFLSDTTVNYIKVLFYYDMPDGSTQNSQRYFGTDKLRQYFGFIEGNSCKVFASELSLETGIVLKKIEIEISSTGGCIIYKPKFEYGTPSSYINDYSTPYRPALTDNVAWDYDTPNNSFQSAKIGNIKNIISYSYHKSLTQVGDFSMTFSKYEKYANLVVEDTFIYIEGDWLIVNNVKLDNDIYTVTGFDGKGLLMQRITLYDVAQDTGTMGYDVCQGSTEAVIKHYIANNIVNPLDDNRKIVGVALGDNQDRGILNDSFISRLDPLHEIVEKMCKYANIGYDVKVDLMNNKQIFDIVDITDKSASQRDRPQIIFEKNRHNVLSLSREFGNSNEKNCYYATKSGGNLEADAITILVTPTDTVAKGIKRREMHLNVSCDSVADIALYAKQQMTPYQKTNSFAIATSDVANYGKLFFIGDKVTIRDTELNITEDLIINGAKVDEANGSKNVVLEFGEAKPKLIRDFNNKINNKGV